MNTLNVALVQQRMHADYQANLDAGLAQIEESARKGADLVVLCELHTSLYFCQEEAVQHFELAQKIPGPLTEQLGRAAKKNRVVIVGSVFEKRARGLYHNTAVVMDQDGSLAGISGKCTSRTVPATTKNTILLPGIRVFVRSSHLHWTPRSDGLLGPVVSGSSPPDDARWSTSTPDLSKRDRLGPARLRRGKTKPDAGMAGSSSKATAVANGLPVLCTNRVGHEEDPSGTTRGIDFWGQSFATDAFGKITTPGFRKRS